MNPIQKIQFGKAYISAPKAATDIHAGGIFFCTPYEDIITFFEDGTVEIRRSVIENFRPMDGREEIDRLNNYRKWGQYRLNDRNYIECIFDDFSMIGLPLNEHPGIIAFHTHFKSGGYEIGQAFKLVN